MGLDFTVLRILVVAGVLRILIYQEQIAIRWNRFDKVLFAWAFCAAVVYVFQWADMSALINRSGFLFDVIGLYWLFRQSIRSWNDIKLVALFLALSVFILTPLVAVELITGSNPFVFLGRVGTVVREGRYRCQAAFPHSIILGLFWSTLLPIFIGLIGTKRRRSLYAVAACACVFIICSTSSSTPLVTMLLVLLFMALFRFRCYGRLMAYLTCGMIVALHIVMNNPVWHLICRIDFVGGSTGWHRFILIDEAVKHFGDWALIGTRDIAHWRRGLKDITNQYVLEGVRGGFATLIIFCLLLVYAVKIPGSYSLRCAFNDRKWLSWGICVSVLGHCISFFGVSYFGQIKMLLYLTFAVVGFIAENELVPAQNRNLH